MDEPSPKEIIELYKIYKLDNYKMWSQKHSFSYSSRTHCSKKSGKKERGHKGQKSQTRPN